jgi:hypothetical protein
MSVAINPLKSVGDAAKGPLKNNGVTPFSFRDVSPKD